MNTRIISSIVLGSVLLVMQPAAMAGKCMAVGVGSPSGCPVTDPGYYETGTEDFRDAVSFSIGAAAASRDTCPGAHVSIEPVADSLCLSQCGVGIQC